MEAMHKFSDYDLVSVEKADLEKLEKFSDQIEERKAESLSKDEEKSFDQSKRT